MNFTEIPDHSNASGIAQENATIPGPIQISMERLTTLGIVTVIASLIAIYIFIALIIYECRIRNQDGKTHKPSKERYAFLMRISAIAVSFTTALTLISQVFQIFLDLIADIRYCDALIKIDFTLTSCIFISVYALLWLRQRSFYVNPSTRHLTSCYSRVLSTMTLILLFLITFINPAVFDSTQWYARTEYGCKLQSSAFPAEYHWAALAIIATAFQFSLLALFIYPLVKHRSSLKSRSKKSKAINKKAEGFVRVIRRAFYLALVCVITDIIVVMVNVLVVTDIHVIPQIAADINILTNTFCSIATFVDWRERLFPCLEIGSTSQRRTAKSSKVADSSRDKGTSGDRSSSDTPIDDKISIIGEKKLVV